jgi:hypothetical protein
MRELSGMMLMFCKSVLLTKLTLHITGKAGDMVQW